MDELNAAPAGTSTAMVVSADPLFRDAAARWLHTEGWSVSVTERDGLRALAIRSRHPIDAILVIGDVEQISATALRQEVHRRWPETSVVCVPASDRPGSYDVRFGADPGEILGALRSTNALPDVSSGGDKAIVRVATLTPRERTVLQHVSRGSTPFQIADELGLSRHTVRAHLANLHRKLGVHRRVELIPLAAAAGLLPRDAASDPTRR